MEVDCNRGSLTHTEEQQGCELSPPFLVLSPKALLLHIFPS